MGKEHWARDIERVKPPGPGTYNSEKYKETGTYSPRFSIKQRHPEREPTAAPPYRSIPTTVGAAPKFTIRPRTNDARPSDTPGPEYIPPPFGSDYLSRRGGTLARREAPEMRERVYQSYSHDPFGPAAHDCRVRPGDKRAPAYSIGVTIPANWIAKNDNPGSGSYSPDRSKVLRSTPKFSIAPLPEEQRTTDTPGPGAYDIPDKFGKRPMTVRPRTRDIAPFATPGPGQYDVQEPTGARSPRCAIRPWYPEKKEVRGVGYHDVAREFDKHPKKTIGQRDKYRVPNTNPGPGDYSIGDHWRSRVGYKMGPRVPKDDRCSFIPKSDNPGPGEYDFQAYAPRPPGWSMTGEASDSGSWIGRSFSPGPVYENDKKGVEKRAPRYTIRPKTMDIVPKSATQDAGYVNLRDEKGRRPGFTIRNREELALIPK